MKEYRRLKENFPKEELIEMLKSWQKHIIDHMEAGEKIEGDNPYDDPDGNKLLLIMEHQENYYDNFNLIDKLKVINSSLHYLGGK